MKSIKTFFIQTLVTVVLFFICDYFYTNYLMKAVQSEIADHRTSHDIYHHTLNASFNGLGMWDGKITYHVCTDTNGFKDSCENTASNQRSFDIGFIGDSFTEAVGMPFENSFVGMFSIDNPNLKVANLGVASYSPTIYFSKIKYLLDSNFLFDHIYVFIDISDIQDEATYFRDSSGVVFESDQLSLFGKMKKYIYDNFFFFGKGYLAIKEFIKPESVFKSKPFDPFDNQRSAWTYNANSGGYGKLGVKGSIDKAVQEMIALHDLLNEKKIKLSVGVYPWPAQLLEMSQNQTIENLQVSIWREFCIERCENFVNIFPIYKEMLKKISVRDIYKKYYIVGDVHFNYLGNKIVFETLSNLRN
jgi:hypothetical protein|tara:strand:- start:2677 stop:3753 length:1077 start_codon:yes stop_codon:yes gene_type:complete